MFDASSIIVHSQTDYVYSLVQCQYNHISVYSFYNAEAAIRTAKDAVTSHGMQWVKVLKIDAATGEMSILRSLKGKEDKTV